MTLGTQLSGAFINDNQPPHHYILKDLRGNYEDGRITLGYTEKAPTQLIKGEKYYIGSDQINLPDSLYTGNDGSYLYFR